jgi:ankyrin repeat protein
MMEALAANEEAKDMAYRISRAPLHWAAEGGHTEAIEQLIDAGADVSIKDGSNWTPLMFAAMNNEVGCMRRLTVAGCLTDTADIHGSTALLLLAMARPLPFDFCCVQARAEWTQRRQRQKQKPE